MKKITCILVICLLLCACSVPAAQPSVSAVSSPSAEISLFPAPSASPSPEETEFVHFTEDCLNQLKDIADKLRTRIGDTEYYRK